MVRAKSQTEQPPGPDAHLSDHEWRLKMAAEGKACDVPGKTLEEMQAAKVAPQTHVSSRVVGLTDEEWSGVDTAIPDVIELLSDVRNVFLDLSYMEDLDQPGVNSILRLAGRAVQSMIYKEVQILDRLDVAVRSSRKGATK